MIDLMADSNGLRTLYVNRSVVNSAEIIAWAKDQGFSKTLAADDLHVTVAYSKTPVDWSLAKPRENTVTVSGGDRSIEALGAAGDAIVLRFTSDRLDERHEQFADIGASWDWPEYKPHLTIAYKVDGEDIDISSIEPFKGDLEFGPEEFEEVNEDWKAKAAGAMDEMAMDWSGVVRLAPTQDDGIAFDRGTVRRYDADQRLHIETANISKANVCPYLGREIPGWQEMGLDADRIYKLLRDPDEMAKGAATFNNLPILSEHVPVSAANHRPELVIGSTGSHAAFDGTYLSNSLVFWAADAIGDIEDNTKKELSSAYRYRADMTPGTHKGERYDGIMRDPVGNHVALVKKGRAGSDVVVGDSKPSHKEISMAKSLLSRKAAMIQGALVASVTPKLAQDAKVDFEAVLKGVTSKNYKAKKAGIAKAFEGKLAQDADIDDVIELLDQLESIEPAEVVEAATDPITVDPADKDPVEDADDTALLEFLKGKLSDEDYQKTCSMTSGTAMDTEPKAEIKDMVTKTAMDEAIKSAVASASAAATKVQSDIRIAERFVRPWAGDIVAQDSAEGVYRAALGVLGIKAEGIHADALKPILEAQPLPGAAPRRQVIAQDSAGDKAYAERFPNANRLK